MSRSKRMPLGIEDIRAKKSIHATRANSYRSREAGEIKYEALVKYSTMFIYVLFIYDECQKKS